MKASTFFLFVFLAALANGQVSQDIIQTKPTEEFENIHVQKLNTDENASTFLIWVKKEVKPHKHVTHTENLYVISGEAAMRIGDRTYELKGGVFINVPKNTVHSVEVSSSDPLKVLSIQSPEFLGKDRVFVEQ